MLATVLMRGDGVPGSVGLGDCPRGWVPPCTLHQWLGVPCTCPLPTAYASSPGRSLCPGPAASGRLWARVPSPLERGVGLLTVFPHS